jgi:Mn-dependent DtxR family transcriptional regulator
MEQSLTHSVQDYLKQIYELTEGGENASTTALAARLKVTPASVTGMVQKLSSAVPPLVEYQKHQGVTLTSDGTRAALEVIRHHRLLETWLVQTLGYAWDEVHEEAERLEHAISEDLERRIAAALGNPLRDPHGEPIPLRVEDAREKSQPLSAMRDRAHQSVKAADTGCCATCGPWPCPGTPLQVIDTTVRPKLTIIDAGLHPRIADNRKVYVEVVGENGVCDYRASPVGGLLALLSCAQTQDGGLTACQHKSPAPHDFNRPRRRSSHSRSPWPTCLPKRWLPGCLCRHFCVGPPHRSYRGICAALPRRRHLERTGAMSRG